MKKVCKCAAFCLLLIFAFWCGTVFADRVCLGNDLIRLHVVANSDSQEDQALKLQVRDAVTGFLQDGLSKLPDAQAAKEYLQEKLPELKSYLNAFLHQLGFSDTVKVSLTKEAFDIREYDTFTLPAGVYESLRITIGEGQGKNWWCVVFPKLCVSAVSADFADTAAGSGFPNSLTGAIDKEPGYEVRFFFLDVLGHMENFFYRIRN